MLVGGQPELASAAVPRDGVEVEVSPAPPPTTSLAPDASVVLRIVYEDDHLLVVDKPAGLVVHPARGNWDKTLVHGLLALPSFRVATAGADADAGLRPGIVHRLDKGTSGLLVVAKSERAREALKRRFQAHDIEREYVALVCGSATARTIDTTYGRHPKDPLRFTSRGRPRGARRAVTHVRVLEALPHATLVACALETGRTHQIRVHLAEQLGTPVLGDPTYGGRPKIPLLAELATQLGRQALHARRLGFSHPETGEPLRFESELPADLERALRALRAQ